MKETRFKKNIYTFSELSALRAPIRNYEISLTRSYVMIIVVEKWNRQAEFKFWQSCLRLLFTNTLKKSMNISLLPTPLNNFVELSDDHLEVGGIRDQKVISTTMKYLIAFKGIYSVTCTRRHWGHFQFSTLHTYFQATLMIFVFDKIELTSRLLYHYMINRTCASSLGA